MPYRGCCQDWGVTPRERMIKSEANLGYAVRILTQNKTNEKGKTGTLATL